MKKHPFILKGFFVFQPNKNIDQNQPEAPSYKAFRRKRNVQFFEGARRLAYPAIDIKMRVMIEGKYRQVKEYGDEAPRKKDFIRVLLLFLVLLILSWLAYQLPHWFH